MRLKDPCDLPDENGPIQELDVSSLYRRRPPRWVLEERNGPVHDFSRAPPRKRN